MCHYLPVCLSSTKLFYLNRAAYSEPQPAKFTATVKCKRDELLPVLAMAWDVYILCGNAATLLVATHPHSRKFLQASVVW